LGAFDTPPFYPIAKPREFLALHPLSSYGYYRIIWMEQLPEIEKNFGSIDAETSLKDQEVTEIYMKDGRMAQYDFYSPDDIVVTAIKQPLAKTKWVTKESVAKATSFSFQIAPHIHRIFVFEDEKVFFTIMNPTKYTKPLTRLRFIGWAYRIEKVEKKPETYSDVPVEGSPE